MSCKKCNENKVNNEIECTWNRWWDELKPFDPLYLTEYSLKKMLRSAFDAGLNATKKERQCHI